MSEDEQMAVATDYQAINQTGGVTPGVWMEAPDAASAWTTTWSGAS